MQINKKHGWLGANKTAAILSGAFIHTEADAQKYKKKTFYCWI